MDDTSSSDQQQDVDREKEDRVSSAGQRTRMQEIAEVEALNLEPLHNAIQTSRLKREEASGNILMANDEIARIEAKLRELNKQKTNWSRWRDYQKTRFEVFDRRMRIDREELRAIEDFQGEPE